MVRPASGKPRQSSGSQAPHSAAAPKSVSAPPNGLDVNFVNVARESGLNVKTIFGGEAQE